MQLTLDALGTRWWITVPKMKEDAASKLREVITIFEDDYSRFKSDSFIGKLNAKKHLDMPPEELVNMLTYALDVYIQTNGVFNISIGSELEKSGYGIEIDKNSKISKDLTQDINVEKDKITISNYVRLDLGGFGKGWLIEKLSVFLQNEGYDNFFINGGGDITTRGDAQEILIENPSDSAEYIGTVNLENNSLASSSNLKRRWEASGKTHSHIKHPKGKVNEDVLSVHVLAPSILFADTFATIFLLVNREDRLTYSARYGFEFMEVLSDNTTFRTPGFPFEPN